MEDNLTANYELVSDIDASQTPQFNDERAFDPVGGYPPFTGSFNGNNHTITGLNVGLFSTNAGTISNVTLRNVTVTGNNTVGGLVRDNEGTIQDASTSGTVDITGGGDVGGLVGFNDGTITDASASGTVSGTESENVGGLVGVNDGTITDASASGTVSGTESENVGGLVGNNLGTITDASASGSVNDSRSRNLGGLVGLNSGKIQNATASGSVIGSVNVGGLVGGNGGRGLIQNATASESVTGNDFVGGLVGQNDGTIRTATASSSVSGIKSVGGLVGFNDGIITGASASGNATGDQRVGGLVGSTSNDGTVRQTFAVGFVSGESNVGGLVGDNLGTVKRSYFDVEATGQLTSDGNATRLTTAEMQGQASRTNMDGLDFQSTWTPTDGYPAVRAGGDSDDDDGDDGPPFVDVSPRNLPGDGTESSPYQISNASELQAMEDDLDANYVLVSNINASEMIWNPVRKFTGSIDGQSHTVTKLMIFNRNQEDVGLFGSLRRATVTDIALTDVTVVGFSSVGGLAGRDFGSAIQNVTVTGSVTGSSSVGGLVGRTSPVPFGTPGYGTSVGTIKNVTTSVNVTAKNRGDLLYRIGGLVGDNDDRTIQNAKASGNMTVTVATVGKYETATDIGGLVGRNRGTITNASASVNIISTSPRTREGAQDNFARIGGLAGRNGYFGDGGTITNAKASGSVTVKGDRVSSIGGLVGFNEEDGTIRETFAVGPVNADGNTNRGVGGLVGTGPNTVENSYFDEQATGQDRSAGGDGVTGLAPRQMQGPSAVSNMDGLDFQNIWTSTSEYPVLGEPETTANAKSGLNITVQSINGNSRVTGEAGYRLGGIALNSLRVKITDNTGTPVSADSLEVNIERFPQVQPENRAWIPLISQGNGIYHTSRISMTTKTEYVQISVRQSNEADTDTDTDTGTGTGPGNDTEKNFSPTSTPVISDASGLAAPIKGWVPKYATEVTVDGRPYTAVRMATKEFPAEVAYLAVTEDGTLVTNTELRNRVALAGHVSFQTRRASQTDVQRWKTDIPQTIRRTQRVTAIAETSFTIRNLGAEILGAGVAAYVTGGTSIGIRAGVEFSKQAGKKALKTRVEKELGKKGVITKQSYAKTFIKEIISKKLEDKSKAAGESFVTANNSSELIAGLRESLKEETARELNSAKANSKTAGNVLAEHIDGTTWSFQDATRYWTASNDTVTDAPLYIKLRVNKLPSSAREQLQAITLASIDGSGLPVSDVAKKILGNDQNEFSQALNDTATTRNFRALQASRFQSQSVQTQARQSYDTDTLFYAPKNASVESAAISVLSAPSGEYRPGQEVTATVEVTNTGDTAGSFFIGYSVKPTAKGKQSQYDNAETTGRSLRVPSGETAQTTVSWTAPGDVPQNHSYGFVVSVWSSVPEAGGERFDRVAESQAFELSSPEPLNIQLVQTTTPDSPLREVTQTTIVAEVTNPSEIRQQRVVNLTVKGDTRDQEIVSIPPGEKTFATFRISIADSGQQPVRIGGKSLTINLSEGERSLSELPGDGSSSNPYQIATGSELQAIEDDLDANYELASDIDLSDTAQFKTGRGFEPIGSENNPFSGSFDGTTHRIGGLQIDRPAENHVGLFGFTDGATIRNVTLANVTVTGNDGVGGLVGSNFGGGNITTVTATGSVTGEDDVGGLVGSNSGTITDASASGSVTGEDDVGGLVGSNSGTITDASASGSVTGEDDVGGLVGDHDGTIQTATASGSVTGDRRVGGLVGINRGTIQTARASASVTADGVTGTNTNVVGGLVGNNLGTITDASASGSVTGGADAGGLVGINRGTIQTARASGSVTGTNVVGGLVGINRGMIQTVRASGSVTGTNIVGGAGGLVGDNIGQIQTARASASVTADGATGGADAGGLVGNNVDGTIRETFAVGPVNASFTDDGNTYSMSGGLVGLEYNSNTIENSYFNEQTTGQDEAIRTVLKGSYPYSYEGLELTTAEMQGPAAAENMPGLAFGENWQTVPGGYPELIALSDAAPPSAEFTVKITNINNPPVGERLKLTAEITNPGEQSGQTTVQLDTTAGEIEGTQTTVDLGGGDSTTETLTVDTTGVDPGSYTATVTASAATGTDENPGDAASFEIAAAPAEFQLEFLEGSTQIITGESYSPTVEVTNNGAGAGTQDISYVLENPDGLSTGIEAVEPSVELAAGESEQITFDFEAQETDALSTGTYDHVFKSADDESVREVELAAGFSLAEFDRNDTGQIEFDDLRYATREYNRENITFEQLRRVLRAYNTDQQV